MGLLRVLSRDFHVFSWKLVCTDAFFEGGLSGSFPELRGFGDQFATIVQRGGEDHSGTLGFDGDAVARQRFMHPHPGLSGTFGVLFRQALRFCARLFEVLAWTFGLLKTGLIAYFDALCMDFPGTVTQG